MRFDSQLGVEIAVLMSVQIFTLFQMWTKLINSILRKQIVAVRYQIADLKVAISTGAMSSIFNDPKYAFRCVDSFWSSLMWLEFGTPYLNIRKTSQMCSEWRKVASGGPNSRG